MHRKLLLIGAVLAGIGVAGGAFGAHALEPRLPEDLLAVYETGFDLAAPLHFPEDGPARAVLTLQACNDEICLPPDDLVVFV